MPAEVFPPGRTREAHVGVKQKREYRGLVDDTEFARLSARYASALSRTASALSAMGVRSVSPKTETGRERAQEEGSYARLRVAGRRVQLPQTT